MHDVHRLGRNPGETTTRRTGIARMPVLGFTLTLAAGACFNGDFVQGLPCTAEAQCGPRLSCIEGFCGGIGELSLCGNGLLEMVEECDDGNLNDGDGCSKDCLVPLGVPAPELNFSPVKRLQFTWSPVLGAEYYQLLEQSHAGADFAQIVSDLDSEEYSLEAPLHLRANAKYEVAACNGFRCTHSQAIGVEGRSDRAIGYFKASNTDANDLFGDNAVLSGDGNTLVVSAHWEDSNATGINGDQTDDSALDAESGAVYVFVRTEVGWSQQAYVKASNAGVHDRFGASVALSDDGSTLAVGAAGEGSRASGVGGEQNDDSVGGAGAVYVFVRSGEDWSQQAYVKASNTDALLGDGFGASLALSGDGNTMAVGAPDEDSRATGVDGTQNDETATTAGAAYVFTRAGGGWSQQAYVKASNTGELDGFGNVALSGDGNTLAVGATGERSSARGINGDQQDDSAPSSGAVYVFTRVDDIWSQQAYVKASNTEIFDNFGVSLALTMDGNTLAVGAAAEGSRATGIDGDQDDDSAQEAGAVYIFARIDDNWSQQAYVKASNSGAGDGFGDSVALSRDGSTLAVGAYGERSSATGVDGDQDDDSVWSAGAVYVFMQTGDVWSQLGYVKAPGPSEDNRFGSSVSLSEDGTTLAVGAPGENHGTYGIGNQSDVAAFNSGAVFLY